MSNLALSRIQKEFKELMKSPESFSNHLTVNPIGDNLMHMLGTIIGPPETPYEGAEFQLDIVIPDSYPFVPPKVKFITRIWHPNISSATGVICLDILKDQWAAAMSLRTVLLSVQALLASPEPDDPQDAMVATQYVNNRDLFNKTASHWSCVYAKGPHKDLNLQQEVEKLKQMGFNEDEARSALSMKNWNIAEATEHLLK